MKIFKITSKNEAKILADKIYKGSPKSKEVKLMFVEFSDYLLRGKQEINELDLLNIADENNYMNANCSNEFLTSFSRKSGKEMSELALIVEIYISFLELYLSKRI